MKWQASLKIWRETRGIGAQPFETYLKMMEEERDEFKVAIAEGEWDEVIDAICDQIVLTENQASNGDYQGELEDHIDVLFGRLKEFGVIPELAMKQCLKEITSRKQDPTQATKWETQGGNTTGEKWQKDRNQDPDTLYTANYKLAKIRPI